MNFFKSMEGVFVLALASIGFAAAFALTKYALCVCG